MSSCVFVDTSVLGLSDYERSKGDLVLSNLNVPGISTDIKLTHVSIPDFLLTNNAINLAFKNIDANDRWGISRYTNSEMDKTGYYAQIRSIHDQVPTRVLEWRHSRYDANALVMDAWKWGDMSTTPVPISWGTNEILFETTESKITTTTSALYSIVIDELPCVSETTITFVAGGEDGVLRINGIDNPSINIVPNVYYILNFDAMPHDFHLDTGSISTSVANRIQASYKTVEGSNSKRVIFIPPQTFSENVTFKIRSEEDHGDHVHSRGEITFNLRCGGARKHSLIITKNGESVIDADVLSFYNRRTIVSLWPSDLGGGESNIVNNNAIEVRNDMIKLHKDDSISIRLVEDASDVFYEVNETSVSAVAHMHADPAPTYDPNNHIPMITNSKRYSTAIRLYSTTQPISVQSIKEGDLSYVSSKLNLQLRNLSSLTVEFYNKDNDKYPILKYGDIQLAFRVTHI